MMSARRRPMRGQTASWGVIDKRGRQLGFTMELTSSSKCCRAALSNKAVMWKVNFCVVVAACVWILAPSVRAGDGKPTVHFAQQQWRILPHAPFRRAADEEITARLRRQID